MRRLATVPARRLWALAGALCLVIAGAGIAQARLFGHVSPPPPRHLDVAVRDALKAPAPAGVTARITFVNHLLPAGAAGEGGPTPLLAGASGRLWARPDGRVRLELQSESGDVQVVANGRALSVYDGSSNTVYRLRLPTEKREQARDETPTLADVRHGLAAAGRFANLTGARPGATADRPSYTVRATPKERGGLLGAAELAWDAARGVPLRFAVYARGQSSPVVSLEARSVGYGAIPDSRFAISAPPGAKTVDLALPRHRHGTAGHVGAAAKRLGFALRAPSRLGTLRRTDVRPIPGADGGAAVVTYGRGLSTIAVLERKAPTAVPPAGGGRQLELPTVDVGGVRAQELATPLGTVLTFQRGGISYTVGGSRPPAAVAAVARGLR